MEDSLFEALTDFFSYDGNEAPSCDPVSVASRATANGAALGGVAAAVAAPAGAVVGCAVGLPGGGPVGCAVGAVNGAKFAAEMSGFAAATGATLATMMDAADRCGWNDQERDPSMIPLDPENPTPWPAPMISREYLDTSDHVIFGSYSSDVLTGTRRDDLLWGGSGNDMLEGRRGDDHLVGGRGRDWLNGGRGDDVLEGGAGNDRYVFGRNFGRDVVIDDAGARDGVVFRGLRAGESRFRREGSDLTIITPWGEVTVRDQFGAGQIERFRFRDATLMAERLAEAMAGAGDGGDLVFTPVRTTHGWTLAVQG